MKNLLLLFSLTSVSILFVTCNGHAQNSRTTNWQKDIDFLVSEIKKRHYVYSKKELPQTLLKEINSLKDSIPKYSDERVVVELQGLMYHLGDGHSYMLPFGFGLSQANYLPLHFYEFSDGLFVIDSDKAHAHLIGAKVTKLGNINPSKIMDDMKTFISQDNIFGAKWIGPFFMRFRGFLERYGLINDTKTVKIVFQNSKGKRFEENIPFIPVPRMRGIPKLIPPKNSSPIPLYLQNVQTNFWFKDIPEKKLIYFQFNQVFNTENETIATFSKRLASEIATKKPKLLIIDVRHNNGGNADLTPPLIQTIKDFEQIHDGKIIVITGRNTFSAAQIFISRLNANTNAIFAGEPSSSKPNFVGEESEIILPYSGAMGSISNRYHETIPNDTRQWIEPSIKITISSKDYFGNTDPVLKAIFNKKF